MERRLQLVSKEPRDKRLFQPLERWVPDTEDFWESDLGDSPKTETPKSSGKGQKRYSSVSHLVLLFLNHRSCLYVAST